MRVRVCFTVDATDDYRMALSHQWDEHGTRATRIDVKRYVERVGTSQDDDLMQEWRDCDEGCQP